MSGPRKPQYQPMYQQPPEEDPRTTALLRQQYAAPTDEAYWNGLESRILASVRTAPARLTVVVQERLGWWSGFGEFRGTDLRAAGLVAATVALLAAGATFVREQADDARARDMATRAAVEATMPLQIDEGTLSRARPHLAPDAPERYLNPLDY